MTDVESVCCQENQASVGANTFNEETEDEVVIVEGGKDATKTT